MSTQHSNSIQQNLYRLADLLVDKFGVEHGIVKLHTNTLISVVGYSDAAMPSTVQFPSGGKKIGLDFENSARDRKVTIWLGKITAGDVYIETPEGIRVGTDRHLSRWLQWLTEGEKKRNHAKVVVAEQEAKFHPPFVCFQYSHLNAKKVEDLDREISEKSIKALYDKFRKIFPEGAYEVHIDAILRDGQAPDEIGRVTLSTGLLEKDFYHGDSAE